MQKIFVKTLGVSALVGLATASPLAAEGAEPGSGNKGSSVKFGLHENFPVQVDGNHYVSDPYGDAKAIAAVASKVERQGTRSRARIKDFRITDGVGSEARSLERFDYSFPESCGGNQFSYFIGSDFTALGYHYQERVVLDVLSGAGGFTAPRLWGPNDQVLNEVVPMQFVAGDAGKDGIGLLQASYVVGLLADLPAAKLKEYGQAYAAAVSAARACN